MKASVTIWIIFLIEPIFTYIRSRRGAKRYHLTSDRYEPSSKFSNIRPCKFIRMHFGLANKSMHFLVYWQYIMSLVAFFRIFLTPILAVCVKFHFEYFVLIWAAFFILIFVVNIPRFVLEIKYAHQDNKTNKPITTTPLAKTIRNDLKDAKIVISAIRRTKEHRKWERALLREIEKCLQKQKGKKVLPIKNVGYIQNKIIPKYEKYIFYDIDKDENISSLKIYTKKHHRLVIEIFIV